MTIRDRGHRQILNWEEDSGGMNHLLATGLATVETSWDNIPREVETIRVEILAQITPSNLGSVRQHQ